jgi:hypothetical protein
MKPMYTEISTTNRTNTLEITSKWNLSRIRDTRRQRSARFLKNLRLRKGILFKKKIWKCLAMKEAFLKER